MIDLEEQLHSYGSALDQMIDRNATSDKRSSSPRSGGRYAALVLVAASIAGGVAIVQSRTEPSPDVQASTPAPAALPLTTSTASANSVAPAPSTTVTEASDEAWVRVAVEACLDGVRDHGQSGWAPPTAADDSVLIPLSSEPLAVRVIITGAEAEAGCTVTADDDAGNVSDVSYGKRRDLTPVDAAGVVIDDQGWQSNTPEGMTGPGYYEATGRAGADVVGVTLQLGDGTSTDAALADGHFYGKVVADDGVVLFQERITWTLQDGTTQTSRADLLDTVTSAEQCAATGGCVDLRLAELQTEATGVDAEVLVDLVVTDAEYQAALRRMAACANEAGGHVTIVGLTINVDGTAVQPALDQCQTTHTALIAEARELVEARERLATHQG